MTCELKTNDSLAELAAPVAPETAKHSKKHRAITGSSEADQERFWKRVNKTPTCWLWTGLKSPGGYGIFSVNNTGVPAHRFSFHASNGNLDPNLYVCHRCDVRECVNPDHLFLGTATENNHDCISKGRYRAPNRPHGPGLCKIGHAMTPENTLIVKGGTGCRLCSKIHDHRRRIKQYEMKIQEIINMSVINKTGEGV